MESRKQHECEIHPVNANDKVDPSASFVNTTSRSKEKWSTGSYTSLKIATNRSDSLN